MWSCVIQRDHIYFIYLSLNKLHFLNCRIHRLFHMKQLNAVCFPLQQFEKKCERNTKIRAIFSLQTVEISRG